MSSTTTPSSTCSSYFLFRRLQSLTGIIPIGVFLISHLITNSSIMWGGADTRALGPESSYSERSVAIFQEEVTWISELPYLLLIEVSLWLAIGFHAALGLYYAFTGKFNNVSYSYQSNWRYSLMRISGYIGIFFIFYHVATLRWGWSFLVPGGTEWSHHYASSTLAAALRGSTYDAASQTFSAGIEPMGLVVSAFYFVGISLLVFHFANGLWTAAITWGITLSRNAQRRWGYVCAALGVGLMVMAWSSLFGFATLDPNDARAVENQLHSSETQYAAPMDEPAEIASEETTPRTHH